MNDAGQVVDVDAAGRDVRGDKGLGSATRERRQRSLALGLGPVAVNRHSLHTGSLQLLGQAVGAVTRTAEHECPSMLVHEAPRQVDAVLTGGMPEQVRHIVRLFGWGDVVTGRLLHVRAHERLDLATERRREQQHLSTGSGLVEYPLDRRQETHIDHSIRLVQHNRLDGAQVNCLLTEQVLESARAGDDGVDALLKCLARGPVTCAPVDGDDLARAAVRQPSDLTLDLCCQLTGGNEHEGTRPPRGGASASGRDREAEHERLVRSSGSAAAHVAPGEGVRDGGFLDGKRAREPVGA